MKTGKLKAIKQIPAAVITLLVLALSGCGKAGEDGTSYLALDWVYAPLAIYFPALPAVISAGTFYEHAAGSYPGEYIAWDGSYYSFTYRIEVNEGEAGGLLSPGEDGADRYYLMYLYSWGPEFYYYDDLSLARIDPAAEGISPLNREAELAAAAGLGLGEEGGAEPESAGARPNRAPLDSLLEPSLYDLDHPQPYVYELVGPGYRLRIEGLHYRPRERPAAGH